MANKCQYCEEILPKQKIGRPRQFCGFRSNKQSCAYKHLLEHLRKHYALNPQYRKRANRNSRKYWWSLSSQQRRECNKRNYRKYKKNNPEAQEKQRIYYQKWYAKNGRKQTSNDIKKICRWIRLNPQKVKASQLLNYAVRVGAIIKPLNCEGCFQKRLVHGHHEDYSKPYNVVWLCASCHKLEHSKKILKIT